MKDYIFGAMLLTGVIAFFLPVQYFYVSAAMTVGIAFAAALENK